MSDESDHDKYRSDGPRRHVAYWLRLDSWALRVAALLLHGIDPVSARFDAEDRLIDCGFLRIEEIAKAVHESSHLEEPYDNHPEDDAPDEEVLDDHRRFVERCADSLVDLHRAIRSSLAVGKVTDVMSPAAWVAYAEARAMPIPWLAWVRSRPGEFPWLKSGTDAGIGPRMDVVAEAAANASAATSNGTDVVSGGAIRGPNPPQIWQVEARRIADQLFLADSKVSAQDSVTGISERIAKDFRERGIHGPRFPLSGATIRREALQGGKWKPKF